MHFYHILCLLAKNVGIDLSSQVVANQVLSTLMSLTSVFGMGTGGPSWSLIPTVYARLSPIHNLIYVNVVSVELVTRSGFEPLLPA